MELQWTNLSKTHKLSYKPIKANVNMLRKSFCLKLRKRLIERTGVVNIAQDIIDEVDCDSLTGI